MLSEARTVAEAYVYLELSMPEGESRPDYRRYATLASVDEGTWALRFDGPDQDLRVTREVTIDKAADREAERTGQRYGVGRSTLVDAGQWYAVEMTAAANARNGIEQLAAGTADEETYWMVVDALATAVAATEEIDKFIPPGAEDVPGEAFWTEVGRRLRGQRRDALRRVRLRGERAFYLRQLDEVRARYASFVDPAPDARPDAIAETLAAAPLPEAAATPVPGPRDSTTRSPEALPARTFAEAYLFMDASPCECGSAQFPRVPFEVLSSDGDGYVARYAGPCDDCGRPRRFDFRFPQRPGTPPESPHRFGFAGDGPSAILDAGDWLATADAYAAFADAGVAAVTERPELLTASDRAALVRLLSVAAYALDEVVGFLSSDADAVPVTAFWTESGREVHRIAPERFDRATLTALRAERWRRHAEFMARYGR